MVALVIWGEDDHQVRAKALATTYNTTAQKINVKPKKITGLDTLVFWGHGDTQRFCGFESTPFVELVTVWKKLNSDLRTIEMLTCNARHRQSTSPDSYTEQVVKKLTTKHKDLKFKALPIAVTKAGSTSDFSILKWHASNTWAYIGTPGDDHPMFEAIKKLEDFLPPRGTLANYPQALAALREFVGMTITHPYAVKRNWKQAQVDQYNQELTRAKSNNVYMTAGTIGMLRWYVTDIN